MASLSNHPLLPRCASCIRRLLRQGLQFGGPQQQFRNLSKKAKEAERNIVVKLLKDVPRYGRAGSYVPLNPSLMRNRWFPARVADYVPVTQLKQLKLQEVDFTRDFSYGVRANLEEEEEDEASSTPSKPFVRPVEIELLSPERSMALIDAFVPSTIDFSRQPIEREETTKQRAGASGAADILTAAAMGGRSKASENAIYGSVTTADVVATITRAMAHNDEAARVVLNDTDVKFVSGHDEQDTSRVKQLGVFKVEIQLPGAEEPLIRNVRVKAKAPE